MIGKAINTLLALMSILLAIRSLENSSLSLLIPTSYLYVLLIFPFLSLATNRNPFNFGLFAILAILLSTKYLPTQSFLGLLNVLKYAGYGDLAESLRYLFTPQRGMELPLVVTAFSISQVVWVLDKKERLFKERGIDFNVLPSVAIAFALGFVSLVTYYNLNFGVSSDRLIIGLVGVCLIVLALALDSRRGES